MAQQTITRPAWTPVPSKDRLAAGEERIPMSYEDYLEWQEGEFNLGEWVDGEVIVFEMPGLFHQRLGTWLTMLLELFAVRLSLGRAVGAEYEMKLDGVRSSRKPDIIFVATEHVDRLTEPRLVGPADIAVEIVSPSSGPRDHRDKLVEYAVAGISEYWVIDPRPLRRSVTVFHLNGEREYEPAQRRADGTLDSAVLADLRLPAAWLLDDPLPDLVDALGTLLDAVPSPTSSSEEE